MIRINRNKVIEATEKLLSVCDGAISEDGVGFNKFDAKFVSNVMSRDYITDKQIKALYNTLHKYKKQLSKMGVNYNELAETIHIPDETRNIKLSFGKYKGKSIYEVAEQDFPYIEWLSENSFFEDIKEVAKAILNGKPIPKLDTEPKQKKTVITLENGKIIIKTSYENKDKCRALSDRRWNPKKKAWECPISILDEVIEAFPEAELSQAIKETVKEKEELEQLSTKTESNKTIKFGDNLELMPFQVSGIDFIEKRKGNCLISWDMGLGKSILTLAYIRLHTELKPVVIVCPASLKLNWKREAEKWLEGGESIYVINGKKFESGHNIYIINYDILKNHKNNILNMKPQLLVCDESHMIKNYKTKRTKLIMEMSDKIPHRLLLTGTPMLNRPKELWTQLHIIDPQTWKDFFSFGIRYCDGQRTRYGWDFSGSSNIDELHERLKTIMIRRTKEEVLTELPPKTYSCIEIELTNRAIYDRAENDFINYIREMKGNEEAMRKARAIILTKIEELKQLSAIGKMKQVKEWIDNFLDTGEKLVLFAHHKDIIDILYEEYKEIAVKLTGSTSQEERQNAVDRFLNDNSVKLFIGNIKSAGVGITLTASSNVAFIEYPWTPSELSQAEDRLNRIGQKNAVSVYYLVGSDTIDIQIIELLTKKSKVINGIIEGKEISDNDILNEIVKRFK